MNQSITATYWHSTETNTHIVWKFQQSTHFKTFGMSRIFHRHMEKINKTKKEDFQVKPYQRFNNEDN